MTEVLYQCPHDGGRCHHGCARRIGSTDCDRKRHGMHLTTPWPGFPVDGDQPVLDQVAWQAREHMTNVPDGHIPWPEAKPEPYLGAPPCEPDCVGCEIERLYPPAAPEEIRAARKRDEEQWAL